MGSEMVQAEAASPERASRAEQGVMRLVTMACNALGGGK